MKILNYVNSFFISVGLHSFIDHYRKIILSAYAVAKTILLHGYPAAPFKFVY